MSETEIRQRITRVDFDASDMTAFGYVYPDASYVHFHVYTEVSPPVNGTWLTPPEPAFILSITIIGDFDENLKEDALDLMWEQEEEILCEMRKMRHYPF